VEHAGQVTDLLQQRPGEKVRPDAVCIMPYVLLGITGRPSRSGVPARDRIDKRHSDYAEYRPLHQKGIRRRPLNTCYASDPNHTHRSRVLHTFALILKPQTWTSNGFSRLAAIVRRGPASLFTYFTEPGRSASTLADRYSIRRLSHTPRFWNVRR
jgi:hypothetical protein